MNGLYARKGYGTFEKKINVLNHELSLQIQRLDQKDSSHSF